MNEIIKGDTDFIVLHAMRAKQEKPDIVWELKEHEEKKMRSLSANNYFYTLVNKIAIKERISDTEVHDKFLSENRCYYKNDEGGIDWKVSPISANAYGLIKEKVGKNYEYYVDTFGDLKKAIRSDHNPEVLYKRNVKEDRENPRIFMACGTEDFLLAPNRRMRNFLKKQKAVYTYVENPGIHDWNFWTPHAYKGIDWLLEGK